MANSKQRTDVSTSRVIRFENFRWDGVSPVAYKEEGESHRGVIRHPLVGAPEDAPFHVRYFEVGPGGYTSHERHEHQHVVIALRGEGEVRLGDRWQPVRFGDVVFVAPNDAHQFRAAGEEPFGFVCIVSAERDRPVSL
ncbi:MAG: cupin domain-containing protein [Gemmatimonadales bacterium]|jgi:quercetin dioxygenase-like cupin family protein